MRAIASATISFGRVDVHVRIYSAIDAGAKVSFNLIHKDCGSRLKRQYACTKEGVVVERDAMVKGYEFAKDRYVTFTDEEIAELEPEKSPAICIREFVPLTALDTLYFDKRYFLGPDHGADRAYRLLARVLEETGHCAVARHTARGKSTPVMIFGVGGILVLQDLFFVDQLRPFAEVPVEKGEVLETELELARQLVQQMSSPAFDPHPNIDEHNVRLLERIQSKIDGRQISVDSPPAAPAPIVDLEQALRQSIKITRRRRPRASSTRRAS